ETGRRQGGPAIGAHRSQPGHAGGRHAAAHRVLVHLGRMLHFAGFEGRGDGLAVSVALLQGVAVEFDAPVPMRDGAVLRANVFRPAGEGRWPVLLNRTPYGKDLPAANLVL